MPFNLPDDDPKEMARKALHERRTAHAEKMEFHRNRAGAALADAQAKEAETKKP